MTARGRNGQWTFETITALGVTTDITTAGSCFGLGRTKSHELHRAGLFPVPVLELGPQTFRVPVAHILRVLGLDDAGGAPDSAPTDPTTPAERAQRDDRTPLRAV